MGLFVDAPAEDVQPLLAQVPLSLLQFHGDEPQGYCQQFAALVVKALRRQSPNVDIIAKSPNILKQAVFY